MPDSGPRVVRLPPMSSGSTVGASGRRPAGVLSFESREPMSHFLQSVITAVGHDVFGLLEGRVLILYGLDAPPGLAELSVLHRVEREPARTAPSIGAIIRIGTIESRITAIGERAWPTLADIGHVLVSFNGAAATERPGEICAELVDTAALAAMLAAGNPIAVAEA